MEVAQMTNEQFRIAHLEHEINVLTNAIETVTQTVSGDPVTKEAIIDRLKQERAKAKAKLDALI